MKTSCLRHPESNTYLQLHSWMFELCAENRCAGLLLSFFAGWHDWKLQNDHYYRKANDIAEAHGDGRPHTENAFLFFTTEELMAGIMGLYGKKAINEALDFLVSLNIISIHRNPNPRYHFDKTKYFIFNANACNEWIANTFPISNSKNTTQVVDFNERVKVADRKGENDQPSSENSQPSRQSCQAITNTTINTTKKNQSINAREDFLLDKNDSLAPVIEVLLAKGMTRQKLYPDTLAELSLLQQKGMTIEMVQAAYDAALYASQDRGFGMKYLLTAIEFQMQKKLQAKAKTHVKHVKPNNDFENQHYETDLSKGLSWIEGDE